MEAASASASEEAKLDQTEIVTAQAFEQVEVAHAKFAEREAEIARLQA